MTPVFCLVIVTLVGSWGNFLWCDYAKCDQETRNVTRSERGMLKAVLVGMCDTSFKWRVSVGMARLRCPKMPHRPGNAVRLEPDCESPQSLTV